MKRVSWFLTGVVAGSGAVVLIGRRVRRRVSMLLPYGLMERTFRLAGESVSRFVAPFASGGTGRLGEVLDVRFRTSESSQSPSGARRSGPRTHRQ